MQCREKTVCTSNRALLSSIPCIPLKLREDSSWLHLRNPAFEITRRCSFPGVYSDDFKNWIIKNEPLFSVSCILSKLFIHSLTGYWYFSYCLEWFKHKMLKNKVRSFKTIYFFRMVKEVQEKYCTASKRDFEVLTLFSDFIFLLLWLSWWKCIFCC